MATLAVFLVLGGGTALASYVISSNSQVGPNTISGHHVSASAHPNLIVGSVGSKDVADDGLTGADIKEGTLTNGQVRQFQQSTNSTSDSTPLLSFRGISLARSSNVTGSQLLCKVSVSSNVAGRYDGYVIAGPNPDSPNTLMRGGDAPVSKDPFGNIGSSNSGLFHITFINLQTDQVVMIDYSIVGLPSNGGCRWQGTAYAAG
jgi:hypothetical protein